MFKKTYRFSSSNRTMQRFVSQSQRAFTASAVASMAAAGGLAPLSASKLTILETKSPKKQQPLKELVFGRSFTDHMLSIDWDQQTGWHPPQIQDYSRLQLEPSSTVFHYALGVIIICIYTCDYIS
jgi:branched-chain amino acid aminotransferase